MGLRGKVLHAGCGTSKLPIWFDEVEETRLDIDPSTDPDIVASILCMGDIDGFDWVYTMHVLEHVYPHQVQPALNEFKRVLRTGGRVMVIVPDLEGVKADNRVLYDSPCGHITGWDLFYGGRKLVEQNLYMAHHTGFTSEKMNKELKDAGFSEISITRLSCHNLMGIGKKETV